MLSLLLSWRFRGLTQKNASHSTLQVPSYSGAPLGSLTMQFVAVINTAFQQPPRM